MMLPIKSMRVDCARCARLQTYVWKGREEAGSQALTRELVLEVVYQSLRATRLTDKKESPQRRAGEE